MPAADLFPPVQYSPLWAVLGVVVVLLVIGWVVFVLTLTRRRVEPPQFVPGLAELSITVRQRYLSAVDDVGRRYKHGEVGFSDAHHELSALVRSFAAESRGVRAQYMTLDDLRSTPHHALAETIESLYPGAFSGTADGSIAEATHRASELVRTWN
jgi:hypothetical protein